jgi:hypothetical protein
MKNRIGLMFSIGLGLALLVYSASRSIHFIMMTLPEDRQILAWFGLAALDGGIIAWLLTYLYGSEGAWQRAISIIMLGVDFLGACAMFTLDTLYQTGAEGMTTELDRESILAAVIGLSIIISLNIGATIAHHILNPAQMRAQAEQEAVELIEDQAISQIRSNAASLASQVAPQVAAHWKAQIQADYANKMRRETKEKPLLMAATPEKAEEQPANPTNRRKPGISEE